MQIDLLGATGGLVAMGFAAGWGWCYAFISKTLIGPLKDDIIELKAEGKIANQALRTDIDAERKRCDEALQDFTNRIRQLEDRSYQMARDEVLHLRGNRAEDELEPAG